jgi:hypothetical protein
MKSLRNFISLSVLLFFGINVCSGQVLEPVNKLRIEGPWDTLPPVLINMITDPYEREDVSKEHPEVVVKLRHEFDNWIMKQQAPVYYSRKQWAKILPEAVNEQ